MAGRRPKPTKLRKLGGKAGHRALNDQEPTPPVGEPVMPPSLGKLAAAEWKSIVAELKPLGMLSSIDGKALAAYCHAYERWVQAEEEVERHGLLIKESQYSDEDVEIGVKYKRNPAVTISNDALKLMKSFLIEFGMTPAARSRLRVEKPPGEDKDPFESFMKRGGQSNETKPVN
jgi:P27 family predicted phage terminase small subunit